VRDLPVARKYAVALFTASKSRGLLEAVDADLESLQHLIHANPKVLGFLGAPDVSDEKKRAFVAAVLGGRVGPLVLEFVDLLLAKRRLAFLLPAMAQFREMALEARGVVRVQATTAVPMGESERTALAQKLQSFTGKTVQMTASVDPKILGGVVVKIGGKILDGSVKTRLHELRESLLAAPLKS
jgi:F-type H+-transporting ATPase subunit delta